MRQVRKIDRIINNKLCELEHWKSIALGASTYSESERVQSSGSKEKMADAVCRYTEIESEINAKIGLLIDTKRDVINTIEKLNEAEYDVLHKIYIQNMDFQELAIQMGKSYSTIINLHGRALEHLQKILDEKKEDIGIGM